MYHKTKLQRSADKLDSIHGRMTYSNWCTIEALRLSKGLGRKHVKKEIGKSCCIICLEGDDDENN